jgi:hypothetical protein
MTRAVQEAVRSVADRQRSVHTKPILATGINRDYIAQVQVQIKRYKPGVYNLHSVLYKYWGIKLHLYEYLLISYFT